MLNKLQVNKIYTFGAHTTKTIALWLNDIGVKSTETTRIVNTNKWNNTNVWAMHTTVKPVPIVNAATKSHFRVRVVSLYL